MDRGRGTAALLALATCIACSVAAPTADNQALDLYKEPTEGCYYNFQHYREGDRIMTNEPCLNCTCHNKMLMCYLKVCPFTKAIGQDCTVEKRADQCCPIVTCPDVPVDLLTSTSTTSPAEYGETGVVKADKYGCTIDGKYLPEGAKVPPTPNKPCEHCYCIRNMTTCVMQECTLHVDGCTPIYRKDVCCPVRYVCDHPEDEIPLLDDMTTTVRPTPGFILTTTTEAPVTELESKKQCIKNDQVYEDGARLQTENPCEHCFCMKGDVVCVVQECGMPVEHEGKSCTALPPRKGQCCPDRYICDGDELTTESIAETPFEDLNTVLPPKRIMEEGSGYRKESDEIPPLETEGSGEEPEIQKTTQILMNEIEIITEAIDDRLSITENIDKISTTSKTSIDYETTEPIKDLNQYSEEKERKPSTESSIIGTEFDTSEKTVKLDTTPAQDYTEQYTEPTFYDKTSKKDEIGDQDKYITTLDISQITTESSLQKLTSEVEKISTTSTITEKDAIEQSTEQNTITEKVQTEILKPQVTMVEEEYPSTEKTKIDDSITSAGAIVEPETTVSDVGAAVTTQKPDDVIPNHTDDDKLKIESSTLNIPTIKEIQSEIEELKTTTIYPEVTQPEVTTDIKISSTEADTKDELAYTTENVPKSEVEITPKDIDRVTTAVSDVTEDTTSIDISMSTTSGKLLPEMGEGTDVPKFTEESMSLSTESQEVITTFITEKPALDNIPNPEENDISPPSRIPGEGDCLLNGIHYKNDTNVPSTNKCHSSCKCISSIISCDPIICSMPPEYMYNCTAVYDTPESCCPTFVCDQSKETVPPQPHSQMQGTENPLLSTPIECHGDECEVREQLPVPVSSESPISCSNVEDCQTPKEQEKPICEGAECEDKKVPDIAAADCEGEECKQVQLPVTLQPNCQGDNCLSPEIAVPTCEGDFCTETKIPDTPTSECNGQECKEISTDQPMQTVCEGEHCKKSTVPEIIGCEGEQCKALDESRTPAPGCENGACDISKIPEESSCQGEECDVNKVPEKATSSCEGEECKELPEVKPSCNSDDCDKVLVADTSLPACNGETCSSSELPEIKPSCEGSLCEKTEIPEISTSVCEGEACGSTLLPEVKPSCEGELCNKAEIPESTTPVCDDEACGSVITEIKPSCEGKLCDKPEVLETSTSVCDGDACGLNEIKPSCEGDLCEKDQIPEKLVPACEGDACKSSDTKPSCDGQLCNEVQIPEVSEPLCVGESCTIEQCEGGICRRTETSQVGQEKPCTSEKCLHSQTTEATTDTKKETTFDFEDKTPMEEITTTSTRPTEYTKVPVTTESNEMITAEVTPKYIIDQEMVTDSAKPYMTSKIPEPDVTITAETLSTKSPEESFTTKITENLTGADEDLISMSTETAITKQETQKDVEPTQQAVFTNEPIKYSVPDSEEYTTEIPQVTELPKLTTRTEEQALDVRTTSAPESGFDSEFTELVDKDIAEKTTLPTLSEKDFEQTSVHKTEISTKSSIESQDNEIITRSPEIVFSEMPDTTSESISATRGTEDQSTVTGNLDVSMIQELQYNTKSPLEEQDQTIDVTSLTDEKEQVSTTEAQEEHKKATTTVSITETVVNITTITTNAPISTDDKLTTLKNEITTQKSEPAATQETGFTPTQQVETESEITSQYPIQEVTKEQTSQESSTTDTTTVSKAFEISTEGYKQPTQPSMSLVTKLEKSPEEKSDAPVTVTDSAVSKTPDEYVKSTETLLQTEEIPTDKTEFKPEIPTTTIQQVHAVTPDTEFSTPQIEITETKLTPIETEDITSTSISYETTTAKIKDLEEPQSFNEDDQSNLKPSTDLLPVKFGEADTESPIIDNELESGSTLHPIDKYTEKSQTETPTFTEKETELIRTTIGEISSSTEQAKSTHKIAEPTTEPVFVSGQDDIKSPATLSEEQTTVAVTIDKFSNAPDDISSDEELITIKIPISVFPEDTSTRTTETPLTDFTGFLTTGIPEVSLTDTEATLIEQIDNKTEEPSKLTSKAPESPSIEDMITEKIESETKPVTIETINAHTDTSQDKTEMAFSVSPITESSEITNKDTQQTTILLEKFDQSTPTISDVRIVTQSPTPSEEIIKEFSTKGITEETEVTQLPEIKDTTELLEPTSFGQEYPETTPYLVELEEHPHKVDGISSTLIDHEESDNIMTTELSSSLPSEKPTIDTDQSYSAIEDSDKEIVQSSTEPSTQPETSHRPEQPEVISDNQYNDVEQPKDTTIAVQVQDEGTSPSIQKTEIPLTTEGPKEQPETEILVSTSKPLEAMGPEEEFIPAKVTTPAANEIFTQTPISDKITSKPSEKPVSETSKPSLSDLHPDEIPPPEEDNQFPPSGGYGQEPDYGDEDQAFGPGTCRYGGKIYVSAQQIPRDDPCDFCFCFRSDIICLQQSCPPPIHGCHEEPIQGFCCPRYECPVSMATSLNVTTTTTTTTTTLPPHFLPHAYKGAAQRRGCHIKGHTYKVGDVVRASSGPCLHCTCGGDGQMKCDPKVCTPEPMLRQMIAAAVSAKRRR